MDPMVTFLQGHETERMFHWGHIGPGVEHIMAVTFFFFLLFMASGVIFKSSP
jgi:hypothetical protein